MSRQSRLIVILAAMALIGVVVLAMVAERYSKLLGQPDAPRQTGGQAARAAEAQVDGFVRVRLALRGKIDSGAFDGAEDGARALVFAAERNRALSAAGVHEADYREIRGRYRQWVRSPAGLGEVWQAAFETRRRELLRCDLGELEDLDR